MRSALVIGSGVGGLTAALLLAQRGYSVTVLERHVRPGGLLQPFYRGGVAYETGFHYCGGVAPGQILGQCLRHLGVFERMTFLPLDPDGFDRVRTPSLSFDVPVGLEAYRERLKEHFPSSASGIDAVLDDLFASTEHYGLYALREHSDRDQVFRAEATSLRAVLDAHIADPLCKAAMIGQSTLYGLPSHEAPLGLHAIILKHFLHGAFRIQGGGDGLALQLTRAIKRLGGVIRCGEQVVRVCVEDKAARGVVLDSGEELRADLVVANLHPRAVLELLPPGSVRPAYEQRVRQSKVGVAHMAVYLQMDGPVPELGNRNLYRYFSDDPDAAYTPDAALPFYYASAPGASIAAPSARDHVVLLLTQARYSDFAAWAGSRPGERPAAYLDLKKQREEQLIQALLSDYPSLRGRILDAHASTPLTTEHYTASPDGAMYGHRHSVDQMGLYRPAQVTRVRDLVMVGQSVFAPGVLGSMLSAYYGLSPLLGGAALVAELRTA